MTEPDWKGLRNEWEMQSWRCARRTIFSLSVKEAKKSGTSKRRVRWRCAASKVGLEDVEVSTGKDLAEKENLLNKWERRGVTDYVSLRK